MDLNAHFAELDGWLEQRRQADGTPGIALAVTDRERLLHVATAGYADIAARRPVAPETLFETGSIGKSFTAIALLQLADEGRIDLNAPVTEYLPWFALQSDFAPITLHHLLTQTAGITAGMDFAPEATFQVWALRHQHAATPPGSFFHYSNVGYKVLGLVLERVGGEHYGPAIRRRILDPMGLAASIPTITNADRPRMAVGYGPLFDDRPWWPGRPVAPATWLETDTGDGCLAMPAADLAAYLRMLLNRGAIPGGRILSDEAFQRMTGRYEPHLTEDESRWYGYGILTHEEDGRAYLGHGGGMVGYFSSMIGEVGSGLGVVALVNGPGEPEGIAQAVLDHLVAAAEGQPGAFPAIVDPHAIDDAAAYAGHYTRIAAVDDTPDETDPSPAVEIEVDGPGLLLRHPAGAAPLVAYDEGTFVTADPALDRFFLLFERDAGRVVAFTHGASRYANDVDSEPVSAPLPAEWHAYPGLYRSFSPWTPVLRVVRRPARLHLILMDGPDGFYMDQPLAPLEDGWFRAGDDERIPERIHFDTIVDGQALRATLSGCEYYRVNQL